MTAHEFIIRHVPSEQAEALAFVCPDARYVSVRWKGENRLERRFVTADRWPIVDRELAQGWAKDQVPSESAVHQAVLRIDLRGSFTLQRVTQLPVAVQDPLRVAATLDAYLWNLELK